MNSDFPCGFCGHDKIKHLAIALHNGTKTYLCFTCKEQEHGTYAGICDYLPDNLRYLEKLSEEKA